MRSSFAIYKLQTQNTLTDHMSCFLCVPNVRCSILECQGTEFQRPSNKICLHTTRTSIYVLPYLLFLFSLYIFISNFELLLQYSISFRLIPFVEFLNKYVLINPLLSFLFFPFFFLEEKLKYMLPIILFWILFIK